MATGVASWSQTAATNATADSNVNWAEGQAPSTVNDSSRNLMASVAKWRDDTSGTLVTSGSTAGTAFTVTSNQVFGSLAALAGNRLTMSFHLDNGAAATLNVDGLGAKALRSDTATALTSGTIKANSIWSVTYDNTNTCFIVNSAAAAAVAAASVASQSDQEAASSNAVFITPLVQQYHPSALKVWCVAIVTGGTPAITASYNVASVTDITAGSIRFNYTNPFSSANYAPVTSLLSTQSLSGQFVTVASSRATIDAFTSGGGMTDPGGWYIQAAGDQ